MAAKADNFKIAGALIPQWVINNGPLDEKSVSKIWTSTSCAATPGIFAIRGSLMLKVNNDGTGGTMLCPKSSKSFHIFGLLPVAIRSLLDVNWFCVVSICQTS